MTTGAARRPVDEAGEATPGAAGKTRPDPGRRTLAWIAATAVVLAAVTAVVLATAGSNEAGLLLLNRSLVRISFPLFLVAFTASALQRLWPNELTRALVRDRRGIGLSFALAHFAHLGAIVALFVRTGRPVEPDASLVVGGLGYAFIAAMAATSNDASQRALGVRGWTRLHRTGAYLVWFIFAFTYAGRVAEQGPAFVPALVTALAALGLRIAARARRGPAPAALV